MACALGIEQDCNKCRMCGNGKGGKKMTNAERIRNMTNEGLAEFLCQVKQDYQPDIQWGCHEFPGCEDWADWEEWLESECDAE